MKISLNEMVEYGKEVISLSNKVKTARNKDEVDNSRAIEIKSILYNDWCSRFESLELAKYTFKAIYMHKDEWSTDDEYYLSEIIEKHLTKDDIIYDLEATMLCILYYAKSDVEYF